MIPDPEDVDLGLLPKPLTGGNESGMVIDGGDQIHHPWLGKLNLTHNIRLPEIVRMFSYQPLYGLDPPRVEVVDTILD